MGADGETVAFAFERSQAWAGDFADRPGYIMTHATTVPPSVVPLGAKVGDFQQNINLVVVEGDSRIAEESPQTTFWPNQIKAKIPALVNADIINYGVGGNTIELMRYQYDAEAGSVAPTLPMKGIFILVGGVNDIGGMSATGAATYEHMKIIWAAARADGYLVVASTEAGAASFSAAKKAEVSALNDLIRSDSSLYDCLIEPDIHVPTTNASYYTDGTHLSDTGTTAFADMVATALNEYLYVATPNTFDTLLSAPAGIIVLNAPASVAPADDSNRWLTGETLNDVDPATVPSNENDKIFKGPSGLVFYSSALTGQNITRVERYVD